MIVLLIVMFFIQISRLDLSVISFEDKPFFSPWFLTFFNVNYDFSLPVGNNFS